MRSRYKAYVRAVLVLCLAASSGRAQGTREDYQRAQQFLPGNLRHHVYVADVTPHWIAEKNRFWYRKAGMKGAEFILVDPAQDTFGPAFDHPRLAISLAKAAKREVQPAELPFDTFDYAKDEKSISFQVDGTSWTCQLEDYECKKGPEPVAGQFEEASPNKEWVAYVNEHDLYLRYVSTGEIIRLTHDGEASWDYATAIPSLRPMIAQGTQEVKQRPAVFWSPDSSKFVTYRMDTRNAGRFTNLQFVPTGQLRPKAFTVVYPLPGEVLPKAEPIIFDVQKAKRIDVKTAPLEIQFQGGPSFEWFPDSKTFYYEADERGEKSIELRTVDPEIGEQKVVIREKSDRYVDPGETFFRFLHDSGEVLWSSERDGWNHLYLYNQKTGGLKNQVTQGPWVVRRIVDVDEKSRRVYFLANGREKGEDPYQTHLYSVGLDGSNLTALTPANSNHTVSISSDHSYFVDNSSRPDLPGDAVLRNVKDGSQVRVLEQSDANELFKTNWKSPEAFHGKAKDGTTDLYGLIWRPSNFDPAKKYPVIEMVYTGPQAFFVPKTFGAAVRGLQSTAELGFIVVMVDGRGTTGRSRAFHEYSYRNLGGAFEDHVAMIKQMAAHYPYMDATRVGIFGTSAGAYGAAHAMLVFPDFYKVGVAISGDHDARLDKAWWNELYQGFPVGPDYAEQSNVTMADRLQGQLLIEHGDIDDNVHVVETMRFADALMKANKDFDMLIVPNMYHGEGGNLYLARRRWDYFVRYLLGVNPPSNFEIHEDREPTPGRPR
ncbi:MAG TPA: DPP IV N-terminal domain-containing protein [Candidatus Limnocylindria bacterium]|nr:DPP IV N-terminal domain-containing protein [Candidatus Limnocylindria bacterium]